MATRMAAAQSFIMVMAVDLFCDAKEKKARNDDITVLSTLSACLWIKKKHVASTSSPPALVLPL
jgi:hypothetical protein